MSPIDPEAGVALKEYLAIDGVTLQQVLADHLQWFESGGIMGSRAILDHVDLSYFDLRNVVLAGAALRGADLTGCDLSGADLHGADLSEAIVIQAKLVGAIVFGANLSNAKLERADLSNAELSSANFSGAFLKDANLSGAALDDCNLREANLNNATLRWANMAGSVMKGATLEAASFADADLSKADLRGAICRYTMFDRAKLIKSQFGDALMEGVDFTAADFLQVGGINEEYRQLSLQAERWRLDQEKARIEKARAELEAARQKMMQKKMIVAEWKRGENDFIVSSAIHAVWMKYLSFAWGAVATLFTGVMLFQASQIHWADLRVRELVVVMSIVIGISALFGMTAWRARKVSKLMSSYGGFFRQKLTQLVAMHSGAPVLDQPAPAAPAGELAASAPQGHLLHGN